MCSKNFNPQLMTRVYSKIVKKGLKEEKTARRNVNQAIYIS